MRMSYLWWCKVKGSILPKPYILKDGVTYGTSLKLLGVRLSLLQEAGAIARSLC